MPALFRNLQKGVKDISLGNLLPSLSAGLVVGVLVIFLNISFAAMLFSGPMSGFVARGVGLTLVGMVFFGVMGLLFSRISSITAFPQDGPIAVLTVIAGSIVAGFGSGSHPEERFWTVLAAVMLTTLLTGVFFYLVGRFNLGNLVRFIPYPVLAGFLSGAGWLMVMGALGVMVDIPFGFGLLHLENLMRWVPGLVFAVGFLFVLNRFTQYWITPTFLIGSTLLFYLLYMLFAGDLASAERGGWLLGPFPEGEFWQPFLVQVVTRANWQLVFMHLFDIGTVILVSAITLLLNLTAISVGINQEVDMNHELKTMGIANMLGSLGGFSVGYTAFSTSILGHRLSKGSRLVGVIIAIMGTITVLAGTAFLSFFPRIIAGGLLLFLGLSFLKEYLYDSRKKLSTLGYLLTWVIVVIVATVGFLEGVFVGILIATLLFGINYSRTRVLRLTTTAASFQSQEQRPILYQQLLQKYGEKLLIQSLQGHIFFGTASNLFDSIRQAFDESQPDFALLDFHLVTGIDSSAMLSITKIKQIAHANQVHLVFTGLDKQLEKRLIAEVLDEARSEHWHIFPDLDEGLAWCENQLIERFESIGLAAKPAGLRQQWVDLLPQDDKSKYLDELISPSVALEGLRSQDDRQLKRLEPYLDEQEYDPGDIVMEEDEYRGELLLIESGQVVSQVLDVSGELLQLKTMDQGTIIGDTGHYGIRRRNLSVIAVQQTQIYRLSSDKIALMEKEDPELAIALHRLVAGQLSERSIHLDGMVQALQL